MNFIIWCTLLSLVIRFTKHIQRGKRLSASKCGEEKKKLNHNCNFLSCCLQFPMRKITNLISNNEPPSVQRCYNQVKFHEIVKITPYHILLTTFIFTLNFTEKTVLIFIVCFFNCTLSLILTCVLRFFFLSALHTSSKGSIQQTIQLYKNIQRAKKKSHRNRI